MMSSHDDLQERQWIRRIAGGGNDAESAFRLLFHRYRAYVAVIVRESPVLADAVEDLQQECFMKVWRGASSYRGDSPVKPWIRAIARRVRLDWLIARGTFDNELEDLEKHPNLEEPPKTMLSAQLGPRARRCLELALERFTRRYPVVAEIIRMRLLEGMELIDIAKLINMSYSATTTRLSAGLDAFAKIAAPCRDHFEDGNQP